ncbi:MAG: hypothetical protein E4H06_04635 [Methanosarcina sp.]|nr:MAG: hypothetical protein E4H06_04635 [Methanosarcina sp.]
MQENERVALSESNAHRWILGNRAAFFKMQSRLYKRIPSIRINREYFLEGMIITCCPGAC